MNNQIRMKFYLTSIFISLTIFQSYGQNEKVVEFTAYKYSEYSGPVLMPNRKFEPMHRNFDTSFESGRIVVNDQEKTFKIIWSLKEAWVCKFHTKESLTKTDDFLGEIEVTTYLGKWLGENHDALLEIAKTKNGGCYITLKSRKVIDSEHDIETWRKVFGFFLNSECF